jgi:hypothetical protein
MAWFSSRSDCLADASISVRSASVRYLLSLSVAVEEPFGRAYCFRRGGCAVDR